MRSPCSRGPRTCLRRAVDDALLAGVLGLCLAVVASQPAFAQSKNVLVIETRAAGRPATIEFTAALSEALAETSMPPAVPFYEWLALEYFQSDTYLAAVRRFLSDKYHEHPPDVIIATSDPAIRFVLDSRAELWPDMIALLDTLRGESNSSSSA